MSSKAKISNVQEQNGTLSFTLSNILLNIGIWDAGPGNTSMASIRIKNPLNTIGKITNVNTIHVPVPNITLFGGLITVETTPCNAQLTVYYTHEPTKNIIIKGPVQLGLDSILQSCGLAPIRRAGRNESNRLKFKLQNLHLINDIQIIRELLLPLKSWTDLIQIVYMSMIKDTASEKYGMVYFDRLAELTGWIYGIGFSFLTRQNHNLELYSYDRTAILQTPAVVNMKKQVLIHVLQNIETYETAGTTFFNDLILKYQEGISTSNIPADYILYLLNLQIMKKARSNFISEINKLKCMYLNPNTISITDILSFYTDIEAWNNIIIQKQYIDSSNYDNETNVRYFKTAIRELDRALNITKCIESIPESSIIDALSSDDFPSELNNVYTLPILYALSILYTLKDIKKERGSNIIDRLKISAHAFIKKTIKDTIKKEKTEEYYKLYFGNEPRESFEYKEIENNTLFAMLKNPILNNLMIHINIFLYHISKNKDIQDKLDSALFIDNLRTYIQIVETEFSIYSASAAHGGAKKTLTYRKHKKSHKSHIKTHIKTHIKKHRKRSIRQKNNRKHHTLKRK